MIKKLISTPLKKYAKNPKKIPVSLPVELPLEMPCNTLGGLSEAEIETWLNELLVSSKTLNIRVMKCTFGEDDIHGKEEWTTLRSPKITLEDRTDNMIAFCAATLWEFTPTGYKLHITSEAGD